MFNKRIMQFCIQFTNLRITQIHSLLAVYKSKFNTFYYYYFIFPCYKKSYYSEYYLF